MPTLGRRVPPGRFWGNILTQPEPKIRLHSYGNFDILDSAYLERNFTMNLILLSSAGVFLLVTFAFAVLFRRLSSGPQKIAASPGDWGRIFSASRYKPMERLLDPVDYRFLQSHAGYSRRILRRLRANRIEIFRGYVRCLGRDFTRVSSALKLLMVHGSVDRSALAGLLLKQRLLFSLHVMSIESKLLLHTFGLGVPAVDVQSLVETLDMLRTQLQVLAADTQPSAAAA